MSEDIKNEPKGLICGTGYTVTRETEALGINIQNLNQKISRGPLKYSEVKQILSEIGYEVIIKKKSEG